MSRRVTWFLTLRLVVAGSFLFGALLTETLLQGLLVAGMPLVLMSLALFGLDALFWLHYRMVAGTRRTFEGFRKALSSNIHLQILFDFAILTWLLVETGGVGSPVTYFFLFHVSMTCLFFRRPISFFYTLAALTLILGSQFVLPQYGSTSIALSESVGTWCVGPTCGYYYAASVAAVYLFVWYLVSTITTSLRKSESELQSNIDELVEMHREKTRYMLTTTHELKAPFTAIHSYVNVLLGGFVGPVEDKVRGVLEKIRERCERMLTMINELLQLANIKTLVQHGSELTKTDVAAVIQKVIGSLEGIRTGKQITFDCSSMGSGPFWILGDAERLEILFTNILSNALYYSPPGSEVRIEFTEGDRFRQVVVHDQGIGIKPEHVEKVFLEHFRSEEAVAMNSNSTGLGLTISKFVIYLHQGRIWLESTPGEGTSVYMEFLKDRSQ